MVFLKIKSLVLSILVVLACQSFVFGVEGGVSDVVDEGLAKPEITEEVVIEEVKDPYMVTYK